MTEPATKETPETAPTTIDTSWYSKLPQDLQGHKGVQVYKDKPVEEVVKGLLGAQQLIGNSIRIPGEGAAPEEWSAVYAKLGVPDDPGKYAITAPNLPEGYEYDLEAEKVVRDFAKKNHFTNPQAQALVNFLADRLTHEETARREFVQSGTEELAKVWGANADRNIALAVRAVKQADPSGALMKALEETGAENHPAVVQLFFRLGKQWIEDGLIAGDSTGSWDRGDIERKITELRTTDPRAKMPGSSRKHREWLEEVMEYENQLASL